MKKQAQKVFLKKKKKSCTNTVIELKPDVEQEMMIVSCVEATTTAEQIPPEQALLGQFGSPLGDENNRDKPSS